MLSLPRGLFELGRVRRTNGYFLLRFGLRAKNLAEKIYLILLLPRISLCGVQKLYNVSGFFALQSRYVGYYEILKNKYNLKLPPERQLKIKNLKIHSIHGKNS